MTKKAKVSPARKSAKATVTPKVATKTSAAAPRQAAVKTKAPVKADKKVAVAKSQAKAAPARGNEGEAGDWREVTLSRMRALIEEADPEMTEERKWRKPSNGMVGVPVWSHHGIVCTGERYKKVVKLTFAHGAKIKDPSRLFNASLEGGTRRAIDIPEGEKVDPSAFKALVKAAVALNAAKKS